MRDALGSLRQAHEHALERERDAKSARQCANEFEERLLEHISRAHAQLNLNSMPLQNEISNTKESSGYHTPERQSSGSEVRQLKDSNAMRNVDGGPMTLGVVSVYNNQAFLEDNISREDEMPSTAQQSRGEVDAKRTTYG